MALQFTTQSQYHLLIHSISCSATTSFFLLITPQHQQYTSLLSLIVTHFLQTRKINISTPSTTTSPPTMCLHTYYKYFPCGCTAAYLGKTLCQAATDNENLSISGVPFNDPRIRSNERRCRLITSTEYKTGDEIVKCYVCEREKSDRENEERKRAERETWTGTGTGMGTGEDVEGEWKGKGKWKETAKVKE